jgi:hypothetical protein
MNEELKTTAGWSQEEETLRNVIEWAPEGPGQHNFLRIVADHLSSEMMSLLTEHGYTIVHFDELSTPADRAPLEELLIDAQSYMNQINPQKIAVIVSKKGREQAMQDDVLKKYKKINLKFTHQVVCTK